MPDQKDKKKKQTPPIEGLGIALGFLILAFFFYYYPRLIGWSELAITIFQVLSVFCLFISIGGAGSELSKLMENKAWNDFGWGLAFSAIAASLFISMERSSVSGNMKTIIEVIVLILIILFSFMVGKAVPSLLVTTKTHTTEIQQGRKAVIYSSVITGLLSIIVLILQLVSELLKIKNSP